MASLVEAIRFRALSSKLDKTEFNTFISEFIQGCGRNILVTSLFNQFLTSNATENVNRQALQTCIGVIKQIMESRKRKPNTLSQTQITIHSLSPELIGELSSYLCQKDNCAFSVVNRAIYIGCNTPNTLRQLDLTGIDDYSMIRLRKYPHLQCLTFQLSQFHQLQLPTDGTTVCNRLQKFVIDGNKQSDFDIEPFMQQTAINLNNIVCLRCKSFGARTRHGLIPTVFPYTKFIRILSKFTQLKQLVAVKVMLNSTGQSLQRLTDSNLQHLDDLKWDGGNIAFFFAILRTHHSQLKGLLFRTPGYTLLKQELVRILTNVPFTNLQSIVIKNPTSTIINQFLKTGRNIRSLVLFLGHTMPNIEIKNMMNHILTQHKSLVKLDVASASCRVHNEVSSAIEKGLSATTHSYQVLIIGLTLCYDKETIDIKDISLTISRIANQLQSMDLLAFKFTNTFKGAYQMHSNEHMIDFKRKNKSRFRTCLKPNCVVVTNKRI